MAHKKTPCEHWVQRE